MKDSCSCGKRIYELDGNIVRIHDIDTNRVDVLRYATNELAQESYQRMTGSPINE